MLAIYYHNLSANFDLKSFKREIRKLPELIQNKLKNYHNLQNWQASATGYVLLHQALLAQNQGHLLEELNRSQTGKPIFKSHNWHFNISHSDSLITCVLTDESAVGIDVQIYKKLPIERYKRHFNDGDWEQINMQLDVSSAFCQLWSKKEAVIKADGRGLDIPLKDIQISINNRVNLYEETWFLTEVHLHRNFTTHIATKNIIEDYSIIELKF